MSYTDGKIYKLVSKQTDKIYIGSTKYELEVRFSGHKTDFNSNKGCSSIQMLKYADCEIVLIENYQCKSRTELELREGELQLEHIDVIVNMNIAGRTNAQYYLDNKDKYAQYRSDNKEQFAHYRLDNKERIDERNAQYRVDNKDYFAQYRVDNKEKIAQWRVDNKEKIAKQKSQYYLDKKEKIAKQSAQYRVDNKEKIAKQKAQYYLDKKLSIKVE